MVPTQFHTRSPIYHLFINSALIFVLVKILVGIYARDLVWGLHHWAFFSPTTQFAALLTTLVLLLLAHRQLSYNLVLRLFSRGHLVPFSIDHLIDVPNGLLLLIPVHGHLLITLV